MLHGWFAVPASGRNRDSLLCSKNRFFSWLDIRLQTLCYVYADSTKLPTKSHLLATQWSVRAWPCVLPSLQPAGLVVPWQGHGVVGAMGSCLQALCKLARGCCMHGARRILRFWNLHMYRCICTVSLIYLCFCAVLSLAASSIVLNAFTPWNNAWASGKVPL